MNFQTEFASTGTVASWFSKGGGVGKKRLKAMVEVGIKYLNIEDNLRLGSTSSDKIKGHVKICHNIHTGHALQGVNNAAIPILTPGGSLDSMRKADFLQKNSEGKYRPPQKNFMDAPKALDLKIAVQGLAYEVQGLVNRNGEVKGRGSFGRVFLGHLQGDEAQKVAIKITKGRAHTTGLLKHEAKMQAKVSEIDNPHLLKTISQGQFGNNFYTVMEQVDGEELFDKIDDLSLEMKLGVLEGAANGIAAMHKANIVHKDLKPENIMVTNGNPPQAKVIDFGFAEEVKGDGVQKSHLAGTPGFMAPELVNKGDCGKASDVYSFGVIMCETFGCSTNKVEGPYDLITEEGKTDLYQKVNSQCREQMANLIWECLDADPTQRPTMAQVKERIAAIKKKAG